MRYINYDCELDLFNNIPAYAKIVPETNRHEQLTGFYYIKFCCNINLARAVYKDLVNLRPNLRSLILYHVNQDETKVILGGRFAVESNIANLFYSLLAKHKEAYGLSKPKKKKEVAA